MEIKKIFVILLMCLICPNMKAQQTATVKSFTLSTDHISAKERRKDLNGDYCALVKVQVVDEIERVEGNKIGKIVNQGVEKWIYMCKGSRNMKIHLKNHLPVLIKFIDYKINGLESNRVYILTLEGSNTENSMVDFTLRYTPTYATVLIDAKTYQGENGVINTQLPAGQHSFVITAKGYEPSEGSVNLKVGKASRMQIDLVNSTSIIDNKSVTENKSTINSQANTMSLETVNVGINGNLLTLKVSPFYSKIKIDGKTFEPDGEGELTTPLLYGIHKIEVEADGYSPNETTINIKKAVSKKIKLKELKEDKEKVKKGVVIIKPKDNSIEIGKTGNILELDVNAEVGTKITLDDLTFTVGETKVKSIDYYLPFGTHEVKAECDGYEPLYFSVNIGNSKVSRKIKLKKLGKKDKEKGNNSFINPYNVVIGQNGNLVTLSVKPNYVVVVTDDNKKYPSEEGQLNIALPYGVHKLLVKAVGYEEEEISVNVGKDKIKKSVKLKKESKKKK